jgi:hypothetical protein
MSRVVLCLLLAASLRGEVIDRIAITVDSRVITELQIDEELRVTAFLNHAPIVRDLNSRRAAADRIVAQLLVRHEMQVSHYPDPEQADIDTYLQSIRSTFNTEESYENALRQYHIKQESLKQHIPDQLSTLSFIELRFRPSLDIPESEIKARYDQDVAAWANAHPGTAIPSFDAARPAILKTLTEEHTDRILDTWLEEARKQANIIYIDKALQ